MHGVFMITENIEKVREKIFLSAQRAGRDYSDVDLMAVSKTRPAEDVLAAYKAGIKLFGENRIKEAIPKFSLIDIEDAQLHLIGHLQKNKAKFIPQNFKCVQSIESLATAEALSKFALASNQNIDILLEYNTSGEEAKYGYRSTDKFYQDLDKILELPNLRIRGLMTMAPFTDNEQTIRTSFRMLKVLFDSLINRYPELDIDTLSMGMSNDYEIAVEEGSNLVRVGTAIFNSRSVGK
ncbi:MAG: YggS family pyridoxal phosphate-dependent enzyme [Spirochaetales bacterium]|nr:YggS family pyridoxal phosphate-dependent enzyme [Spirochaetales bacterium]